MYDPQTCRKSSPLSLAQVAIEAYSDSLQYYLAFIIQCAVRRPNGMNSPLEISSTISLGQLRLAISEKLSCFPDHLVLQYRLDSDKAKMGATSIQADSELEMFITRMRSMIIPPRLANGKPSTHALKSVLVYFENAATQEADALNETHGNKKATASRCILILYSRTDKKHLILEYITSSALIVEAKLFVGTEW